MTNRTCSVEGCERKHRAKGYCEPHYQRAHRGRGLDPEVAIRNTNNGRGSLNQRLRRHFTPGDPQECWIWTGTMTLGGYGVIRFAGRNDPMTYAHRAVYEDAGGEIPEGYVLDHGCRNPSCVNPNHLRPATVKQNNENQSTVSTRARSGVRGVHWHSRSRRWVAQVKHNSKYYSGGSYSTVEEAADAVRLLRLTLFTHNEADRGSLRPGHAA